MKYIAKKIGTLIITLVVISFFSFLAFSVIPGDAALFSLGIDADDAAVEALREELGLNDPVLYRYGSWLLAAVRGDFGDSLQYYMPVKELLADKLPVTFVLALYSMGLIVIASFPLGLLGARRPQGAADHMVTVFTQLGMAVPPFFLGIVLTYIFGIVLHWFPIGSYVGYEEDASAFFSYLILPAVAIAVPKVSMLARFIRNSVVEQMQLDYVRTARSKGNTERRILLRHVLINAMIPVVTMLAMMAADVLAGSIVVEQVFNIPGFGRLLITSISNRDYPVVQAIVLYIAAAVVIMNAAADVLYQRLDPRVS